MFATAVHSVTNTCDGGPGSLRESILQTNAAAVPCKIVFCIGSGPQTIKPLSTLPAITNTVALDATSQPGFAGSPLIEIDGSQAGPDTNGLVIFAGDCTIRGVGIVCFDGWGIIISGTGGNRLSCNFVGTDILGSAAKGNQWGVEVRSSHNVIGGTSRSDANVISGNRKDGLFITGDGGNVVQGNFIGTDVAGERAVANGWHGVLVLNSPENLIGGNAPDVGNIISGNGRAVRIAGSEARYNRVCGNLIGTDISGTRAVPNRRAAVLVFNAPLNIIGGYEDGDGNVISGNDRHGVNLCGDSARLDFEDAPLTRIAIGQGDCHSNIVAGNRIGTDITGTKALPNGLHGVITFMAQNNTIGGMRPGAGNLISANLKNGVTVQGSNPQGKDWRTYMRSNSALQFIDLEVPEALPAHLNTKGNIVAGNIVGLDASGMTALGNGESGIAIHHASENIIGGIEPEAANIVSCNGKHGVHVTGSTSIGNEINGNLIGCDSRRESAPGNAVDGVRIHNGSQNKIGGEDAGLRNVIVGNKNCDVSVHGEQAADNIGRNFYTLPGNDQLSVAQMKQRVRISRTSSPSNGIA